MAADFVDSFRAALLAWYDEHARDLPWRKSRDPYAIWVSEVMLQQTTVRTVSTRWPQFLQRFPTVEHLARASEEEVLREWTGLGYYARARNLHRAARAVSEAFGGQLPDDYRLLLSLPGMGVYTAAAVGSIAYGIPVAVVDANVDRVMTRVALIEEALKLAATRRRIREQADTLLDPSRPGDFNQAMMELGATICLPTAPRCALCPVRSLCAAHAAERERSLPNLGERRVLEPVTEVCCVVRRGDHFLLLKRPAAVSFGGLWEAPRDRISEDEAPDAAAVRIVAEQTGLQATRVASALRIRHTVMNNRITLHVYQCTDTEGKPRATVHDELRWVDASGWEALPCSTTQRRVARFFSPQPLQEKAERGGSREPDLFTPREDQA